VIDLHSHILPGIDDGARSLEVSLEMARIAVADGTRVMACTPHIYPGLYMNDAAGIQAERDKLQQALDTFGIPLHLVIGADAHLVPELLDGLKSGRVPTLNGSRYFLLEPSHHVAPPGFEDAVFQIMAAGYVPVITHPERLVWIEDHYPTFVTLARRGCWLQLTVHLVASDAHTVSVRSPRMSDAIPLLERLVGVEETARLLRGRPQAILDDVAPDHVPPPPGLAQPTPDATPARGGLARLRRLLSR